HSPAHWRTSPASARRPKWSWPPPELSDRGRSCSVFTWRSLGPALSLTFPSATWLRRLRWYVARTEPGVFSRPGLHLLRAAGIAMDPTRALECTLDSHPARLIRRRKTRA